MSVCCTLQQGDNGVELNLQYCVEINGQLRIRIPLILDRVPVVEMGLGGLQNR